MAVPEIVIFGSKGQPTVVDGSLFRMDQTDGSTICSTGYALPGIPSGGRAEIRFIAGYGAAWRDVPADLALAALSLTAARYEDRAGTMPMPKAVVDLVSPYRYVRLSRSL